MSSRDIQLLARPPLEAVCVLVGAGRMVNSQSM